ncbi:TlpA family protein disulfide reductase [Sphingomonas caeni]|uniref:TlpA family protein disulfide reductase n=1 Tax=Sphingomonas caeni TaxID=2984949 RepID=UPI0029F5C6A7|nr:TlpA disulfide reductase family protein [Sphingomonas caeni]
MIPLLLLAALAIGGCDRQSQPQSQANETINASTADAESAGNETVVEEVIGTLDRKHAGETAPTIAFQNPAGAKTSLADFRGKPVLLNLWATWCIPCVKEMPTLDTLAESLGDSVTVLALSQDSKDVPAVVDSFFQKAGFKRLQPYIDSDSAFSLSMGEGLPVTILYDSNGKEVWRMRGGMDWTGQTARELIAEAK